MADIKVKKKRKKKKTQAELLAELKIAYQEGRYATISHNIKSLHKAPKYLQEASKQYRREQRGAHRKRTGAVKESKYTETISPKVTKPKTTKPKTPKPKTPKPNTTKTRPTTITQETPSFVKAYIDQGTNKESLKNLDMKELINKRRELNKEFGEIKSIIPTLLTPITRETVLEEMNDRLLKQQKDLTEQFQSLMEMAEYKGIDFNPVLMKDVDELGRAIKDILNSQIEFRVRKGWTEWQGNWYNSTDKDELEDSVSYLVGLYYDIDSQEMKDLVMSVLYTTLNKLMLSAGFERFVNSSDLFSIANTVAAYSISETTTLDELKNSASDVEVYKEEDFSYASLASLYYV